MLIGKYKIYCKLVSWFLIRYFVFYILSYNITEPSMSQTTCLRSIVICYDSLAYLYVCVYINGERWVQHCYRPILINTVEVLQHKKENFSLWFVFTLHLHISFNIWNQGSLIHGPLCLYLRPAKTCFYFLDSLLYDYCILGMENLKLL